MSQSDVRTGSRLSPLGVLLVVLDRGGVFLSLNSLILPRVVLCSIGAESHNMMIVLNEWRKEAAADIMYIRGE